MITSITIENFKGIRDRVKLDFRPITLLFGANSAGKSTILHALHYAREVFERHNLDADQTIAGGKYIDLGGFEHFVNRRDHDEVLHAQKQLRLRIEVALTAKDLPSFDANFDLMSEQLELNASHAGAAGRRCP
jgi:predicted ATPase